ncbi:hypothetical protein [Clostridium thermopalmarium]|nr:hypothetical protein [Clostridium thermopalmarium]
MITKKNKEGIENWKVEKFRSKEWRRGSEEESLVSLENSEFRKYKYMI